MLKNKKELVGKNPKLHYLPSVKFKYRTKETKKLMYKAMYSSLAINNAVYFWEKTPTA